MSVVKILYASTSLLGFSAFLHDPIEFPHFRFSPQNRTLRHIRASVGVTCQVTRVPQRSLSLMHNPRGRGRPSHGNRGSPSLDAAAAAFQCTPEHLLAFTEKDPFNPANTVHGVICKHEGPLVGSMLITQVNNDAIDPPALIYGTPSFSLPYGAAKPNYVTFPAYAKYTITKKWNGVNVSIFKYPGPGEQVFLSAKPRFFPFVSESSASSLGPQLRGLLGDIGTISLDKLPPLLAPLANRKVQSVSLELCGKEEPHLVTYEFPLTLKPLFATRLDGRIAPLSAAPEDTIGPADYDAALSSLCQRLQAEALHVNEEFRKQKQLSASLWFGHFAVEGHVLYLLDESGSAARDAIYKIKPADVEPNHWVQFDSHNHARVFDALEKLYAKDRAVTEQSLREEMGISAQAWGRFSRDAMALVAGVPHPKSQPGNDPRRVLVMVGCPGSGKSTAAKKLAASGWARVNQDEMGTRRVCEQRMEDALKKGQSVVVDRCNFDFMQRHTWVQLASKYGVTNIETVVFATSQDVCKQRVTDREDHPTIPKGGEGVAIVEKFRDLMILPRKSEGFVNIYTLHTIADSDAFCVAHALTPAAPAAPAAAPAAP